jgi:hypothetical protein
MITLGLDPSLTGFGWCIHDSTALGAQRIVHSGLFKTSSKALFIKRYADMRENVSGILRQHPNIEAVGVESPPFGELWSEGLYGLFLYVNEAIWMARKDVVFFDPGTVKMLAKQNPKVVKGKMFKSDMVEAARAETGRSLNHNVADAYHIGKFAARFWTLLAGGIAESDLTPAEYQAFAKIHTFVRGKRKGQTVQLGAMFKENQRFFRYSKWSESPVGDSHERGSDD